MKRQVLIVDDDEDDCDLFSDALHSVDPEAECKKVFSAENALMLLHGDYKPDFIFLDISMPTVGGLECLVEIAKIDEMDNTVLVVYTTSKRRQDVEDTKRLGANHFITKPVAFSDLCSHISFVLNKDWPAS